MPVGYTLPGSRNSISPASNFDALLGVLALRDPRPSRIPAHLCSTRLGSEVIRSAAPCGNATQQTGQRIVTTLLTNDLNWSAPQCHRSGYERRHRGVVQFRAGRSVDIQATAIVGHSSADR